jgi:hypothetical protein
MAAVAVIAVSGCSARSTPVAGASPEASSTSSASSQPSPQPSSVPSPVAGTPLSPSGGVTPSPAYSGVPVPRSNAAWVFDAATGKFLLFGGNYTTGNYNEFPQALGDSWTWDGTTWTQLDPTATSPIARYGAQAVFDAARGHVLLVGGSGQVSGSLNDTWIWDGARWLLMGPSQSPPTGFGIRPMAWDPVHGYVLMFDWTGLGMGVPPLNQTWTWDGTNWKLLPTTTSPTSDQGYGFLAYDPGRKLTVFFGQTNSGQETWTFNGTSWSQLQGAGGTTSSTFAMASDDAEADIVLFGENGDTWTWDGSKWTSNNPIHSPGARKGATLTYDSVHHVVVLFGGASGQGASLKQHNDMWTWDGSDWTKITSSAGF